MVSQSSRHGGRPRLPALDRARAVGRIGLWQRLPYPDMRQAKIIISMVQGELLPHAVLALAQRADPSSDGGHVLADGQVEALHERRVDLPAARREHLLHRLQ